MRMQPCLFLSLASSLALGVVMAGCGAKIEVERGVVWAEFVLKPDRLKPLVLPYAGAGWKIKDAVLSVVNFDGQTWVASRCGFKESDSVLCPLEIPTVGGETCVAVEFAYSPKTDASFIPIHLPDPYWSKVGRFGAMGRDGVFGGMTQIVDGARCGQAPGTQWMLVTDINDSSTE